MNRQPPLDADSSDLPANDVFQCHACCLGDLCRSGQKIVRLLLLALREQVGDGDSQGMGQEENFLIGDTTDARFDLGQRPSADVQSRPLAFGRELVLGDAETSS